MGNSQPYNNNNNNKQSNNASKTYNNPYQVNNTNPNTTSNIIPPHNNNTNNLNVIRQGYSDNLKNNIATNNNNYLIPKKNYIGKITTNDLITAFNANSIDNFYLNREKFNSAIKLLLNNLNLPTIAYTHLTDKLYDIMDDSGDGRIQLDEFVIGMSKALSDSEFSKKRKLNEFKYIK